MEKAKAIDVLRAQMEVMQIEISAGQIPLRLLGVTRRMAEIVEEVTHEERQQMETEASLERGLPAGKLKLSPQETNVALLVARGMSNKEIARELDVSEATAKVHVKSICRKNSLKNRTVLAARVRAQTLLGIVGGVDQAA